jgi:hypothetical protein
MFVNYLKLMLSNYYLNFSSTESSSFESLAKSDAWIHKTKSKSIINGMMFMI